MLEKLNTNYTLSEFKIGNKHIPPLGLGTSRIASIQTGLTKKQGIKLLEQAFQAGFNLIDTADIYGQGESESLIGKFIQDKRNQVIVSTKAGFCWNSSLKMRLVKLAKPLIRVVFNHLEKGQQLVQKKRDEASTNQVIVQDFSASYLEQSITASLKRLNTDYLDIFFLHEPNNVIHEESTYQKLLDLKSAGLIRSIGLCTPHLAQWKNYFHPTFDFLQTKVNPWTGHEVRNFYSDFDVSENSRPHLIAHAVFTHFKVVNTLIAQPEIEQALSPIFGQHLNASSLLLAYAKANPNVANILLGTINNHHLAQNIDAYKHLPDLSEKKVLLIESLLQEASNT